MSSIALGCTLPRRSTTSVPSLANIAAKTASLSPNRRSTVCVVTPERPAISARVISANGLSSNNSHVASSMAVAVGRSRDGARRHPIGPRGAFHMATVTQTVMGASSGTWIARSKRLWTRMPLLSRRDPVCDSEDSLGVQPPCRRAHDVRRPVVERLPRRDFSGSTGPFAKTGLVLVEPYPSVKCMSIRRTAAQVRPVSVAVENGLNDLGQPQLGYRRTDGTVGTGPKSSL